MTRKVTIADYDCGNLFSVRRALEICGGEVEIGDTPEKLEQAERLVLPGVGAFGDAMAALRARHMHEALPAYAATGRPFLAICVGMQMLFEISEEFGEHQGLGLMRGRVTAIPATGTDGQPHKIPHIGWSEIIPGDEDRTRNDTIFFEIEPPIFCYFVHSYTAAPAEARDLLAYSDYDGRAICAAVRRDNLWGCQFHPEKSGPVGIKMIQNFLRRQ